MAKVIRTRRVGSMVSGSKVTGLALRGALHTAAEKQITAAGCVVGMGAVTFGGAKAYAQWKERSAETVRNQKGRYHNRGSYNPAGIKTRNYRINYPAIAADAVFTRAEADLIAGYTLHETGHILYSCIEKHRVFTAVKLSSVHDVNWRFIRDLRDSDICSTLQPIWNGIEDARMENTVVRAGVAAGAANLFARLLNKLTNEIDPSFNPCESGAFPFSLALLCRHALGNSNPYSASLLERIPEPKRSVFAATMQAMSGLKVGYDKDCESWVLAAKFYMAMEAINEQLLAAQPATPTAPDMPEQGKREDGFGDMDDTETDAEDEEFEDKVTDPDAPSAPAEPESAPDFLGDDDQGDDTSGGEDGDKREDGEDGEAGDGEDGDSEGQGDAEGEDAGGGDAQDDGEQSPGEGGFPDVGTEPGTGGMFDESTEQGVPIPVEPSVDDIFERGNKRGNAPDDPVLRNFDRAVIDKSLARMVIGKYRSENRYEL